MGYAEALAQILYPNSAAGSLYTAGGKALLSTPTPQLDKPWQTALAAGLQNLAGYGLQGYAQYKANQDNLANAAAMVPQLAGMGIQLPEQVQAGLTSEDPRTRQLAVALAGSQMDTAAARDAKLAEIGAQQQQKAFEAMMSGEPAKQRAGAQYLQSVGKTSDLVTQLAQAEPTQALRPVPEAALKQISSLRNFQDTAAELKSLASQMDDKYVMRKSKGLLSPDSPEFKFNALLAAAQQDYASAAQSGVLTDQDRAIYDQLFKGSPTLDSKKTIVDRIDTILSRGNKNFATTLDTYKRAGVDVAQFEPLIAKPQEQPAAAQLAQMQQEAPLQRTNMVPPTAGPAPVAGPAAPSSRAPIMVNPQTGQTITFDYATGQWVSVK